MKKNTCILMQGSSIDKPLLSNHWDYIVIVVPQLNA